MSQTELRTRGVDPNRMTDKQRHFVFEYCKDYNGTRAAKASGYKNPAIVASQLVNHPLVSAAIGKIQRLDIEQLELDRHEILMQLYYAVTRDPIDFCDPKTGMIIVDDMRKIPKHLRCCIDGIKVKQFTDPLTGITSQTIELKLVPKLGAIDLAMKHKGLFAPVETKNETKVSLNFAQLFKPPVVTDDPVTKAIAALEETAANQITIEVSPEKKPLVKNKPTKSKEQKK